MSSAVAVGEGGIFVGEGEAIEGAAAACRVPVGAEVSVAVGADAGSNSFTSGSNPKMAAIIVATAVIRAAMMVGFHSRGGCCA